MRVFEFRTTKAFLKSYITHLPYHGRGEASRVARALGVSPTLVSQITSGDKNFTSEQAMNLCRYLKLTPIESDYLMAVVQKDRAGTVDLREYWNRKLDELQKASLLLSARVESSREMTESEKSQFYSSPLYALIGLYSSVGKNGKSIEDIAKRFRLTRDDARSCLEFLVRTGNCEEREGMFHHTSQKNHLSSKSQHIMKHHANWRLRAVRRAERLTDEELMYSVPVSLSKKDFPKLREEMIQFVKKFLTQVHASEAEELACFNLDFFWIDE